MRQCAALLDWLVPPTNLKDGFKAALRLTDLSNVDLVVVHEAVESNMRRLNAVNARHVYETLRSWNSRTDESNE